MHKRYLYMAFLLGLTTIIPVSTLAATPTEKCALNNTYHQVVNKNVALTKDYVPKNLVIPNVKFSFSGKHEKKYMEKEAAGALEKLFAGAAKDKHTLVAISGYRSYTRQSQIFNQNIKQYGEKEANRSSARPGQSEHQTGLAMDISAASVGYNLTSRFGTTKEGKWLAAHAHEYGFIIRYPKDKEKITGYVYEPWHVRYVGKELATHLYENKITLEEINKCCEKEAKALEEQKKLEVAKKLEETKKLEEQKKFEEIQRLEQESKEQVINVGQEFIKEKVLTNKI